MLQQKISKHMKKIFIFLYLLFPIVVYTQSQDRWKITDVDKITWTITDNLPHYDHIEMSGEQISVVLRYGVNSDGSLQYERSLIWPMLRTIPNNTHASLMQRLSIDYTSLIIANGMALRDEKVQEIIIDGKLIIKSNYTINNKNIGAAKEKVLKPSIEITRTIFPSKDLAVLCERYAVKNIGNKTLTINIPNHNDTYNTLPEDGVEGSYTIESQIISGEGITKLAPDEIMYFDVVIQAYKDVQAVSDYNTEENKRAAFVKFIADNLIFDSPDSIINAEFFFAKIRASESIYKTKGGYMHGPGGESYYAAIWANDQAEYVNPFFPFLGYDIGNKSAINSFRHFKRYINDDYSPIPSSIIAEGTDIWNGAGDRGDAAMIAYGASRYALARGDKQEAHELYPLISWCLEYCKFKTTKDGVVASDTDELEGRFPSGDANLCTSSLYYDALISASYISKELFGHQNNQYLKTAKKLKKSINNYFGDEVEGYDTYRYYDGNDKLRAWICIPLTVGIFDRASGTAEALFSPQLWTKDGILTESGDAIYWDRATLYALRGTFAAGSREEAINHLEYYSRQRLLGEHVPYPIEACPEGSQRHLSAESGLYCRVITEGLFGIRPTGFNSFNLTPQLPDRWNYMNISNIHACSNKVYNIKISRKGQKINVVIENGEEGINYLIDNGSTIEIVL